MLNAKDAAACGMLGTHSRVRTYMHMTCYYLVGSDWLILHFVQKFSRRAVRSCLFKVALQLGLNLWGSFSLDKSLIPVCEIATRCQSIPSNNWAGTAAMHAPWQVSKVLSESSSCGNIRQS